MLSAFTASMSITVSDQSCINGPEADITCNVWPNLVLILHIFCCIHYSVFVNEKGSVHLHCLKNFTILSCCITLNCQCVHISPVLSQSYIWGNSNSCPEMQFSQSALWNNTVVEYCEKLSMQVERGIIKWSTHTHTHTPSDSTFSTLYTSNSCILSFHYLMFKQL